MEPLPFDGYDFEVQPDRITEVVSETGCGLVLDTGHARVSAARLGLDAHDYLARLPLNQLVEVHVSGPRVRDGRLVDAHEPLEEIDYALLDWVLKQARPQLVALEYTREADALRDQLLRIRDMLG